MSRTSIRRATWRDSFGISFLLRAWLAAAWLVVLLGLAALPQPAAALTSQGPGGPILVLTSAPSTNAGDYYAEILRTEGLNAFEVADVSSISAAKLANYDLVLLAKATLTQPQIDALSLWVNAGGNLIAMAPQAGLASLLGLVPLNTTLSDGYLLIDTSSSPGNGITGQTMQYHGAANLYSLASGTVAVATLFSNATTATSSPAVSLRTAGSGRAAAFSFDLATSIVQTRQGNPAWAAQERDGFTPIRSDDKFYGNAATDPKPDWIDLAKVAIPQADEQQRLLANLILEMNGAKKPLPRFWYFPQGRKAVVVMTGDDHGNGGTAGRFDQFLAASPAGCSLADWQCVRGTSYIYPSTPVTDAQAAAYAAQGFEIGLHVNTGCADFDAVSLESTYAQQLADWQARYSSLPAPVTMRHHCIVWSDWSTAAQVELNHAIRLDTSYYYWPPSWVNNVPGFFNGTAMPMRLADPTGQLIDVFEATSQMTDESGQTFPFTIDTLLDRALGSTGYYGAYVVNAHTDDVNSDVATAIVASAKSRSVPVISSQQLLRWLDGRNASNFNAFSWNGSVLNFGIAHDAAANGLQALLPMRSGANVLGALTRAGSPVSFAVQGIKGVEYAVFDAAGGSYAATYSPDVAAPSVVSTVPANGASGVDVGSAVTVTFSDAMNASTINAATVQLRDAQNNAVAAAVGYDAASRTATLKPSALLQGGATYSVQVRGGTVDPRAKDAAGNAASAYSGSFTTASAPACPCSAWSNSTVPTNPQAADGLAVELGVKFSTTVDGFVTGIRFYKGSGNTGTHLGNLWGSGGQLLASATFTAESASGWQQVAFAQPVAVTANTVYTASYYAPNGNYAADQNFFASAGVQNGPVTLLSSPASGGNGVYAYGSQSSFPAATYLATNYWVDVVFSITNTAPVDTVPPTVSAVTPVNGATAVATGSAVQVSFSEAIAPATVTTSSFELRTATAAVPASVSYDPASRTATLVPSAALAAGTAYTVLVHGGATDPRVKDLAGNALAANFSSGFTTAAAGTGACATPANPIVAENCLPGNPASEWDISGVGDATLEGFAAQISVNRGSTVQFKVRTPSTAYRFDIYRLGWYGGLGARKVASVTPSASLPQSQPACINDAATGLIDCGNWAVSGSWAVPATAVSGIYIAKLVRSDTTGSSHIAFIVRDDASTSKMLFQTSDTTWQAYNSWGGNSVYAGGPGINPNRAYKVSYNRPFNTRIVDGGQDWLFNAEYPMLRWLESNGYDLSYMSGVDVDQRGNLLLQHPVYLSVGHDEYWSAGQRANVEAARAAGVHLAFFSGNEVFWKTRWENSIDGSNTPYRTMVTYKETHANAKIDPTAVWTGTWRDPRFSPPADGGKPENALTGTIFMVNNGAFAAITVPPADGRMRFWRNTPVATAAAAGTTSTLTDNTVGYEWDVDADNGVRPAGLFRLSTTTVNNAPVLQDYGSTYASGTATHSLTYYRHASGARVFGAGTVQWSWGLDGTHDRAGTGATAGPNASMRQATVNLFADLGVQPATLQSGLTPATASTDVTAPTTVTSAPAAGATIPVGSTVTISGTASDTGGQVAGVEVSVDNGSTWHPATGRATWSYAWTPQTSGAVVIRSRAVDDSGNLGTATAGTSVTVAPRTCPCSLWSSATTPAVTSDSDAAGVTLGVRFSSDQAGTITAIRFYKGSGNTGTHVGSLWSSGGQLLASGTFSGETASGWQQLNFTTPVAITANTVYIASYFAPAGHYAADVGYFATAAFDSAPLHALRDGSSGANGIYTYGSANAFPTSTYQSANYWVDVVFSTAAAPPPDTTPPTVTAISPASGATNVARTASVTATFSEAMTASSIDVNSFRLTNLLGTAVAATVTYNATTRVATLKPTASLAALTTYTVTVRGGSTDPRVKDAAGNALAANRTWSFRTQ